MKHQGAVGGLLEQSGLAGLGEGIGTLFGAEQLTFEPQRLVVPQIDLEKLAAAAVALQVNLPGDDEFAGSRLAGKEKRRAVRGKLIDDRLGFSGRFRFSDIVVAAPRQTSQLDGRNDANP